MSLTKAVIDEQVDGIHKKKEQVDSTISTKMHDCQNLFPIATYQNICHQAGL
jgi:hypothetical protein